MKIEIFITENEKKPFLKIENFHQITYWHRKYVEIYRQYEAFVFASRMQRTSSTMNSHRLQFEKSSLLNLPNRRWHIWTHKQHLLLMLTIETMSLQIPN